MRYLFAAVCFLGLFTACDSNEPVSTELTLRPLLFEEADFKREYSYNASNQLTEIRFISTFANGGTMTSKQNFTYLSNGKLSETTSDTGFRFAYTYNGDKIVRTDEYVNGSWSRQHDFKYDSRGRLIESITRQNIPEEGGLIPTHKDTYEYDGNDNLVLMRMYYYTSFGAEAVLQTSFISSNYDDKINTEDKFELNVFNPYVTLRKNNPGKLITQNGQGVASSTEVYTYEYHPKGYATKKTTQLTWYHGGTGSYTSTYQFSE